MASNPWFQTGLTIVKSEPAVDGKTKLFVKEAPMVYRSEIKTLNPVKRTVVGALPLFHGCGYNGKTLTNTKQDKFWRFKGDATLDGQTPVSKEDFAPDSTMCLWEYGPGDAVTLQAKAMVSRGVDGKIAVDANVPGSVAVFDKDGNKWVERSLSPATK